MREKIRNVLVTMLAFIVTLSTVGTAVPVTVQAAAKTAAVNKSITLATSKTVKTKDIIKSVKSSKRSILSVEKISSKKFKVTSQYRYGSAAVTVKFKNGKTAKYNYSVGKYSLRKGTSKTITAKYTIKSVKSDKTKIALVKKNSSKKFKVTAKNAGTAKITVRFKNGKKAVYDVKVTGSSSGSGNNNTNDGSGNNNTGGNNEKVSLNKTSLTMTEGDTTTLKVSIPSVYSDDSLVSWDCDNTSVLSIREDFTDLQTMKTVTVKAVGAGTATITAFCMLHTEDVQVSCRVTVNELKTSASVSGFKVHRWTTKDTFKREACPSRDEDGTNQYTIEFFCDGSEYWINNNVVFEVEDVTPPVIANMFSDMGIEYEAPDLKIDSMASDLREWNEKKGQTNWGPITFQEPFTDAGPGNEKVEAVSGKKLTINAGMSTRALKIVAKQGEVVLDYAYVTSTGINIKDAYTNKETYSEQDQDLYRAVLDKVENALWEPGMANLDKLLAMADYINDTNHYPGSDTTVKEYNPTFWRDWSVDDKFLLSGDHILDNIMILQGSYCDCTAARLLMEMARDELGIEVFDKKPENGEGVWIAAGPESSTPINPNHVSMGYRDPEGAFHLLDVSGMNYSHSNPYTMQDVTCEAHGCREKVIPLK